MIEINYLYENYRQEVILKDDDDIISSSKEQSI